MVAGMRGPLIILGLAVVAIVAGSLLLEPRVPRAVRSEHVAIAVVDDPAAPSPPSRGEDGSGETRESPVRSPSAPGDAGRKSPKAGDEPNPARPTSQPPESGTAPELPSQSPKGAPVSDIGDGHAGPEPPSEDPCIVPLYYQGRERRQHIALADLSDFYVRVTVEGWTSHWRLLPDKPGTAYISAVRDFDPKRAFRGADGRPRVRLTRLQLGGRRVEELELGLDLGQPFDGGVFGAVLMEAFGVSLDLERGVLVFDGCAR